MYKTLNSVVSTETFMSRIVFTQDRRIEVQKEIGRNDIIF